MSESEQKLDKAKPRLRAGSWEAGLEEAPSQSLYCLSSSSTFLLSGMPVLSAAFVSHRGTCKCPGDPAHLCYSPEDHSPGWGQCMCVRSTPTSYLSQPKTLSVITADRTGKSGDVQSDHQIPLLSSCSPSLICPECLQEPRRQAPLDIPPPIPSISTIRGEFSEPGLCS